MKEKYQPTQEELNKAEDMLTDKQRAMVESRKKEIERFKNNIKSNIELIEEEIKKQEDFIQMIEKLPRNTREAIFTGHIEQYIVELKEGLQKLLDRLGDLE